MSHLARCIVAFVLVGVVGCSKSGSTTAPSAPSPVPAPAPAPQTFSLSGRVTETPPTSLPVDGATLTIIDGPNAGLTAESGRSLAGVTATTGSDGRYQFSNLIGGGFSVQVTKDGYQTVGFGIDLRSNTTHDVQMASTGPRRQFGPGQYLVNREIAPGRYYTNPSSGCYWERESGVGGTFDEIIANEFIGFNAGQWIVDILGSDFAFKTDGDCGTWFDTPRRGLESNISPGLWLVGSQVQPGTYSADTSSGCYWQRNREFTGGFDDIIANDFVADGGRQLVTISGSDAGFQSDDECGVWTPVQTLGTVSATAIHQSRTNMERAWRMNRERSGVGQRR